MKASQQSQDLSGASDDATRFRHVFNRNRWIFPELKRGLSHTEPIRFQEVLRKFGSFNLTCYNGLEALTRVLVVAKHIGIPNVFETNMLIHYILPAKKLHSPSQDG